MNSRYRQHGLTLSGLLYACGFLGMVAVVGMRLFPLYNEKMKVDLALERVAGQKESAKMTKLQLAKLVGRQFEVSDVDRWTVPEFAKLLKMQKVKGSKDKMISLVYEIRGPFFGDFDIVMKYENTLKLGAQVTD